MIPATAVPLVVLLLASMAMPARAAWTPVAQVPNSTLYSVWANGDTIAAGGDSTVYFSTDAGVTWKASATITSNGLEVERVRVRHGRLFAGTRRAGVFVSDDLGDTWSNYNQGLVGGFADSQLDIVDMLIRGDSIYVATEGAGAWVRNFDSGTWHLFGGAFAPAQATNMTLIAAGGLRLFAAGGFNGTVFFRDPADPDWTLSLLFNDQFAPGLAALSAVWTGTRWVVGSNLGIFYSDLGESPWMFSDPGAGSPLFTVPLVQAGHDLIANFGAFTSTISLSRDDGATWQTLETLPMPVTGLAVHGGTLYASRTDGLWRRPVAEFVSVEPDGARPGLAFAVAGAQPVGDRVRFAFALPEGGPIAIEVFDLAGRRVAESIRETRPAGHGELNWDASRLAAGVYHARLTGPGGQVATRLVRTGAAAR